MNALDDPRTLALDAGGMLAKVRDMGPELVRAWHASEGLALPPGAAPPTSVVIAGMGGSATAGDYFAALCAGSSPIPVTVVRGYTLPAFVSESSLVVVSSYSGNTEESLACYDDARKRGAPVVVTTTGGELGEWAKADGAVLHRIAYGAAPRAATAHSLAPLLRLGALLGLLGIATPDIEDASEDREAFVELAAEEVPLAHNPAKELAEALHDRLPLVMGAEHLAPVASRFKNQLAENGKMLGAADTLPEADHNLIVGLATAAAAAEPLSLVALESERYHPRVEKRFGITASFFEEAGVRVHRIGVSGRSLLGELLVGTAWGDYVSCYLAFLNGLDPTPVPQIDRLKAAMAS